MPVPASLIVIAAGGFANLFQDGPPAELPAMRRYEPPAFPLELRASALLDGHATAAFTVDPEGKVMDVVVLEANHAAFANALTSAIGQWQLQPVESSTQPRREVVRFIFMRTGKVGTYTHREAARAAFSPGEDDRGGVTTVIWDKLKEKPTRVQGTPPAYPSALQQERLAGQATVSYIIDTEGRVRVPVATSAAHPAFGSAAVQAVQGWRFTPSRDEEGSIVLVEDSKTFTFGSPQVRLPK